MKTIVDFINQIANGKTLSRQESSQAFDILMSGEAEPAQIGGFLMALRMRGETIDEITGAAELLREKAQKVEAPEGVIDTCGTGGDASGTFNISTCAAFVIAGCGVPVAKHGNRSISSKSGSADVLQALGVNLVVSPETVSQAIRDAGIGFMFAPAHHAAMKHVGPSRQALGTRTIFNILGPLANPAGAKRQVIGVFDKSWLEPLANALKHLGSTHVWVVHGEDGLDELTTTGETFVAALKNNQISTFTVSPQDAGLEKRQLSELKGGNAEENAAAIRDVLNGKKSAFREIVLFNAAAALIVADKVQNLQQGVELAAKSIDNGYARDSLDKLIALTA